MAKADRRHLSGAFIEPDHRFAGLPCIEPRSTSDDLLHQTLFADCSRTLFDGTPNLLELRAIAHHKRPSLASQCDHGIHLRCPPGRNEDGQQSCTHEEQRGSAKHQRIVCLDGEEQTAH
jgi:hypothetical protein